MKVYLVLLSKEDYYHGHVESRLCVKATRERAEQEKEKAEASLSFNDFITIEEREILE